LAIQGKSGKRRGKGQGFASFTPERRREISAMGGREAHRLGTAHKWDHDAAVSAGRKGGLVSRRRAKLNVGSTEKTVKKQGGRQR